MEIKSHFFKSLAGVLLLILVVAWLTNPQKPEIPEAIRQHDIPAAPESAQLNAEARHKAQQDHYRQISEEGYGQLPAIDVQQHNPQLDSVLDAVATPTAHPTRLSAAKRPAAFNYPDYLQNKTVYLNEASPGRIHLTARPGTGARPIKRLSAYFQKTSQGETVQLQVQAAPHAPVSFFSINGGIFANQLNSITVDSGAEGQVAVDLTLTPGVIADVNIIAACPLNLSQAKFIVNVRLPNQKEQQHEDDKT